MLYITKYNCGYRAFAAVLLFAAWRFETMQYMKRVQYNAESAFHATTSEQSTGEKRVADKSKVKRAV